MPETLRAIKRRTPSTHGLLATAANTARNDQNTARRWSADSTQLIHANCVRSAAIEMLSGIEQISATHTRAEKRHCGTTRRQRERVRAEGSWGGAGAPGVSYQAPAALQ